MVNSKVKTSDSETSDNEAPKASVTSLESSELEAPPSTTAVLGEALALIDGKLGEVSTRELVSCTEFTDVLLDLRILLAAEVEALSSN